HRVEDVAVDADEARHVEGQRDPYDPAGPPTEPTAHDGSRMHVTHMAVGTVEAINRSVPYRRIACGVDEGGRVARPPEASRAYDPPASVLAALDDGPVVDEHHGPVRAEGDR